MPTIDHKMFPSEPALQVSSIGELGLISRIRTWLGEVAPPSPRGMGDDCAVIRCATNPVNWLHTTDTLSHGVHFDDKVPAAEAGRKLINRNLSDIAAMGGTPDSALL